MADTGSDVAEGATRDATGAMARVLERQLMMRLAAQAAAPAARDVEGTAIEVRVGCPEGADLDGRAERVFEALEHMGASVPALIDDSAREVALVVAPEQAYRTLRALELLSTSTRCDLTMADVGNVGALEALAGRRAIGRSPEIATAPARPESMPVESVALTFANHVGDHGADARDAAAYASRMVALGFDAAFREVDLARRGASGGVARERASVVGVSYLASGRDDFLAASGVALHEIGIAAEPDPYAKDPAALAAMRDRLAASADERRAAFEANRRASAHAPAVGAARGERTLTAEEYASLPALERAMIDPSRIPEGAFGRQRVRDVAREQAEVARLGRAPRSPERPHPSIGER